MSSGNPTYVDGFSLSRGRSRCDGCGYRGPLRRYGTLHLCGPCEAPFAEDRRLISGAVAHYLRADGPDLDLLPLDDSRLRLWAPDTEAGRRLLAARMERARPVHRPGVEPPPEEEEPIEPPAPVVVEVRPPPPPPPPPARARKATQPTEPSPKRPPAPRMRMAALLLVEGEILPPGARTAPHGDGLAVLLAESAGCRVRGCPCSVKRGGLCKGHLHYARVISTIRQPRLWDDTIRAEFLPGYCIVARCCRPPDRRGMCKLHYDRATRAGREDLLLPAAERRDDERDERLRQVAAEWRLRGWAPMRATDPAMLRLLPGGAAERKNALRRAQALGLLRCDGKGTLARWSLVQR